MLLLTLLSFVLANQLAPLEFFPPGGLVLDDQSKENNFQIRLTSKPASNVTVFYSGSQLVFRDGFKTFTPINWNIGQIVNLRAAPFWAATSAQIISLTARVFQTPTSYKDITYQIYRPVVEGGKCRSYGDPHVIGFGLGISFTNMRGMAQRLFQNKHFEVQAIQVPCSTRNNARIAYCNRAFAMRYGSSTFVIDFRNQSDASVYQLSPNIDGVRIKNDSGVLTFYLPEGSQVTVSQGGAIDGLYEKYMSITMFVTPSNGLTPAAELAKGCVPVAYKHGGACNHLFANRTQASYMLPDGTYTTNAIAFSNAWAVPADELIFNGFFTPTVPVWRSAFNADLPTSGIPVSMPLPPNLPYFSNTASISATYKAVGCFKDTLSYKASSRMTIEICVETCYLGGFEYLSMVNGTSCRCGNNDSFALGVAATNATQSCNIKCSANSQEICGGSTYASVFQIIPESSGPLDFNPTPEFEAEAIAYCEAHINGSSCGQITSEKPFIDSCVEDAMTTGAYTFADSHKSSFLSECYTVTKMMMKSSNPIEVAFATGIQLENGLGSNPCPGSCVGGTCTKIGCICKAGYYGMFCLMTSTDSHVTMRLLMSS